MGRQAQAAVLHVPSTPRSSLPPLARYPNQSPPFESRSKVHQQHSSTATALHAASISLSSLAAAGCPASKDLLCVAGGLAALVGYHIRLHCQKVDSWSSRQAATRVAWSMFVIRSEGWLYAVQTLRNAITANTFLATTVLTLLTVISGKLWSTGASLGDAYAKLQFASMALCMLLSAYEFLQSARLMTHAGFMFPVVKSDTTVCDIMRKASISQWLGLRWLYVSAAGITWRVLGEAPFLAVSLALTVFFRCIDRVPVE